MTDRNTVALIDASCLVSASASPSGGSGFILSVCRRGLLRAATSNAVLVEAERNIKKKMGSDALARHRENLRIIPFEIIVVRDESISAFHRAIAGDKDAHIITAAIELGAEYVITLDLRLVSRINASALAIVAMTPGEFINGPLLLHPEHGDLREV